MAKEEPIQKFDEGVAQLDAIVKKLESGDLPLEQALAAFESGISMWKLLSERLNAAESQVEVLTRAAGGGLQVQPFAPDDE